MIYLDNNATTFLDPHVLAAIKSHLSRPLGNPSSIHRYGREARALLIKSAKEVAHYFGCLEDEIVFTSGATEALNMVIRNGRKSGHIISSSLEHPSVLESLKLTGCEITYLDPNPGKGAISLQQIKQAYREDTKMLVFMAANNETGIKTDIEAIAAFAKQRGLDFVVDAVASLGRENWTFFQGITAACFSGHKIHAPTGVGMAIIRKSMKMHSLLVGGAQQHNMRAGSENLAGIVGFTKALDSLPASNHEIAQLRDHLEEGICSCIDDVIVHGIDQPRICNTSNIAFKGVDGETLLMQLDLAGVAVSHASACVSGGFEPSRVLLNMGLDRDIVRSSIRFSLSRFTTQEEIDQTIQIVSDVCKKLKNYH